MKNKKNYFPIMINYIIILTKQKFDFFKLKNNFCFFYKKKTKAIKNQNFFKKKTIKKSIYLSLILMID